MFIFRVEHDRSICDIEFYKLGGKSYTGHGPIYTSGCASAHAGNRPNFGSRGNEPAAMMAYERCAVTAETYYDWISPITDYSCFNSTADCEGSSFCNFCDWQYVWELDLPSGWVITAYWVEDDAEGIDWRYDNNQVVFNPAFAVNMGNVSVADIQAMAEVAS